VYAGNGITDEELGELLVAGSLQPPSEANWVQLDDGTPRAFRGANGPWQWGDGIARALQTDMVASVAREPFLVQADDTGDLTVSPIGEPGGLGLGEPVDVTRAGRLWKLVTVDADIDALTVTVTDGRTFTADFVRLEQFGRSDVQIAVFPDDIIASGLVADVEINR
jgi:hypothetical protein